MTINFTGEMAGVDRKRKVPGRQAGNAIIDGMSSDDDDEVPTVPQPARQSTRRGNPPRVDLGKLDESSLRRYKTVYKLGEGPAGSTKDDILPGIKRHFENHLQNMDESDVLLNFMLALKKSSIQPGAASSPPPALKKTRVAVTANGKAGKSR